MRAALLLYLCLLAGAQAQPASQTEPLSGLAQDHFTRGMELARAGQWEQAREQLLLGRLEAPRDARFPAELAGIAYRTGDQDRATAYLKEAQRLDPGDTYVNDFLGTLYFLDTNFEAALKYWNRAGRPVLNAVQVLPPPPVEPVLFSRALGVTPGEVLDLKGYRNTVAWLRSLNALGTFQPALVAASQDRYNVEVRWGGTPSRWSQLTSILTELPASRVRYEASNLGRRAISASALWRWDAQKRRLLLNVSGPWGGDPKARYRAFTDARSETWNVGLPADFRLQKLEGGASLRFTPNWRLSWETGFRLAAREYSGPASHPSGVSAVYTAQADVQLLAVPEHRFDLASHFQWDLGRFFATGGGLYSRAQGSLQAHWRPRFEGNRYEGTGRIGFGSVAGPAPFDELFSLGRERDDNIPLRGHTGTYHGKKGVAPIGGQYFVANLDFVRETWRTPLFSVDIGPLLDVGRMWRQVAGRTPDRILVDAGAQIRLRFPSGFAIAFSYARDLRGGRGTFDMAMR